MRFLNITSLGFLLLPVGLFAQDAINVEGLQWGPVLVRPEASVLEAYDNRAQYDQLRDASGDFYTEVAAGVSLKNLPARYDLSAKGHYGYRFYSDYIGSNDDFYDAGATISSGQNPFKWGVSADMTKSLNYSTAYNPSTGDGPDSILADGPNRRSIILGYLAYERQLSEKTSIIPSYDAQYYLQEFASYSNAEWQVHSVGVQLRKEYSIKTRLTVRGGYSVQINDREDGSIGTVEVGVESAITDKTSWQASVGFSAANYEISGSDQGGIFNLRVLWLVTEKVSAYVFGGNDYQPGYGGGGARMVYRAGYGADWQMATRWSLGGSVLHDYQDSVDGAIASPGTDEVRNFFTAYCGYNIARTLQLSFSGSYIDDQYEIDQIILAVRLGYKY